MPKRANTHTHSSNTQTSGNAPSGSVKRLLDIMVRLRAPDGCPWDKAQTHQSLKKYLVEESAEFLDAVDENDRGHMTEELGDVLLQIVFHCQIAEEAGAFTFDAVVDSICEKLIRRHPHVFGEQPKAETEKEVLDIWKKTKLTEKKGVAPNSRMDGIPKHLPALMRAHDSQKRAAEVGFDWKCAEHVVEKIEEELAEIKEAMRGGDKEKIEEEIGDLIFSGVNLARFLDGTNAEEILAKTVGKFQSRFRFIEDELAKKDRRPETSSVDEMEKLWNLAKKNADPRHARKS